MIWPRSAAAVAGTLGTDHAERSSLLHPNLTGTTAVGTGLNSGSLFCTGAMTIRAAFHFRHGNLFSDPSAGFEKRNTDLGPDIAAPTGRIRICATGSAPEAAEKAFEDISQVPHIKAAEVSEPTGSASSAAKRMDQHLHGHIGHSGNAFADRDRTSYASLPL